MKKSIKYSVALVGTTLLGATMVGEKPDSGNLFLQNYQNSGNDSFLTKLGKELQFPNITLLRQSYASGFIPTPTTPPPTTVGSGGTGEPLPDTGIIDTPTQPTATSGSPNSNIAYSLAFAGFQSHYNVGDVINISAQITAPNNSQEPLDLWVALYIPGIPGDPLFFLSGSPPSFDQTPRPFRSLSSQTNLQSIISGLQVSPDVAGEYVLFALLVAEGQNPLTSDASWRSNLAKQSTVIHP